MSQCGDRARSAISRSPSKSRGRSADASDTCAYSGRVTYHQWQSYLQSAEFSGNSVRGRARSVPAQREGSAYLKRNAATSPHDRAAQAADAGASDPGVTVGLGVDSWLLVLLFAHSSALLAFSRVSRSFAHPSVQCRGNSDLVSIMQLTAWLRCGMNLIQDELPDCEMPGLPDPCRSWVELLHGQEVRGEFCSLLFVDRKGKLCKEFVEAVETLNQTTDTNTERRPAIYILPSTSQHVHLSDDQSAIIKLPVSVHGLSLPNAPHTILRLKSLKIQTCGSVKLHNLSIIGSGSDSGSPRGVSDSAIWVTAGACDIRDAEVCLPEGRAGFGISVGNAFLCQAAGASLQDASVSLYRTTVSNCSTGCIAYNAGKLMLDAESALFDCGVDLSACDRGSQITVDPGAQISADMALTMQEISGGSVRTAT